MTTALQSFISDLLPDGFFWRGPAADRFVRGTSGSFQDVFDALDELPADINPLTAPRDILLQYAEYIGPLCVAIPSDTEELRALVVQVIASAAVETPVGLAAYINALFPLVDVAETPANTLPSDLPFDLEPSGRVLTIWHSPLLTPAALIECVTDQVKRAGDVLRLVTPGGFIQGSGGQTAAETAIFWHYAAGTHRLRVVIIHASGATLSDEFYVPTEEHGVDTLDNMSTLAPTDEAEQTQIAVTMQRDFGDGVGFRTTATFDFEYEGFMSDVFAAATLTVNAGVVVIEADNRRNIDSITVSGNNLVVVFTTEAAHNKYHVSLTRGGLTDHFFANGSYAGAQKATTGFEFSSYDNSTDAQVNLGAGIHEITFTVTLI